MDVTPLVKAGSRIIQSYAGGVFKISGEVYQGGVIVREDSVESWGISGSVRDFTLEDFQPLIDLSADVDVVLLGCGDRIEFLSAPMKTALKAKGLHVDVMDSGAACRTYNVLMAEGRRVVAALVPTTPKPQT